VKICFISFEYPPKSEGGIGTYAEHLARGLNDRGINVYTITRGDKVCYEEKKYRVPTPDALYWRRFFFTRQAISLIYKLHRLHKFDLVHLNGGTYPITRKFKLPMVTTFHAPPNAKQIMMGLRLFRSRRSVNDIKYLVLKNSVGSLLDFLLAEVSDRIICPSPFLARDLMSYCFVDERKIHVVPNGVDLRSFDETESFDDSFLDKYAIERENFLLYMGRLSFFKGVQHLIEAYRNVQKKHKTLKLVIAGRGDFEPNLRIFARGNKGIVFVGYVASNEVKKLLYDASVGVILPSRVDEVSPMVLLEAMACSKPVVATNVGGNPFMIRHGKNGFLSRPKDSESLAKCVNVLYENQGLRRKMGMFGRKLVEQKFSLDRMITETLKVYNSLSYDAS